MEKTKPLLLSPQTGDHVLLLNTYACVHYHHEKILCVDTTSSPSGLMFLISECQTYQIAQRLNAPFLNDYRYHTTILAVVNGVVGLVDDNEFHDDLYNQTNRYRTVKRVGSFLYLHEDFPLDQYPYPLLVSIGSDADKERVLNGLIEAYTFDNVLHKIGKITFFNQLPSFRAKLRDDKITKLFLP